MTNETGPKPFGLNNKRQEGFHGVTAGKWYRVWLSNQCNFYIHATAICNDTIEGELAVTAPDGRISMKHGFVQLSSIDTCVAATEDDVRRADKEDHLTRHLQKYIRINTNLPFPLCGQLQEVTALAAILQPYVHSDLATGMLSVNNGELTVRRQDIAIITPSSWTEMIRYVRKYNKEMARHKS